jgi:hypothetical protein
MFDEKLEGGPARIKNDPPPEPMTADFDGSSFGGSATFFRPTPKRSSVRAVLNVPVRSPLPGD